MRRRLFSAPISWIDCSQKRQFGKEITVPSLCLPYTGDVILQAAVSERGLVGYHIFRGTIVQFHAQGQLSPHEPHFRAYHARQQDLLGDRERAGIGGHEVIRLLEFLAKAGFGVLQDDHELFRKLQIAAEGDAGRDLDLGSGGAFPLVFRGQQGERNARDPVRHFDMFDIIVLVELGDLVVLIDADENADGVAGVHAHLFGRDIAGHLHGDDLASGQIEVEQAIAIDQAIAGDLQAHFDLSRKRRGRIVADLGQDTAGGDELDVNDLEIGQEGHVGLLELERLGLLGIDLLGVDPGGQQDQGGEEPEAQGTAVRHGCYLNHVFPP